MGDLQERSIRQSSSLPPSGKESARFPSIWSFSASMVLSTCTQQGHGHTLIICTKEKNNITRHQQVHALVNPFHHQIEAHTCTHTTYCIYMYMYRIHWDIFKRICMPPPHSILESQKYTHHKTAYKVFCICADIRHTDTASFKGKYNYTMQMKQLKT